MRSQNAVEWEEIGTVAAQSDRSYRFIDHEPHAGLSFYRLSYRDMNGNPILSPIRKAYVFGTVYGKLYPIPSKGKLFFDLVSPTNDQMDLTVLDMLGRPIQHRAYKISAGTNKIELDFSTHAEGNYTLVITFVQQEEVLYHRFLIH